jgi:hypothetical protein
MSLLQLASLLVIVAIHAVLLVWFGELRRRVAALEQEAQIHRDRATLWRARQEARL